ncbi:hypothetical protein O3G_MSEX014310 [Manduca sexta]|uniref:FHA domain-containing protein n=1 Tax=Manduca sexta TaxID=7130 RepID=A0A921ZUI6_MANSE|nr:hypothetical protein O3G_MSEX014310 [Manduca sexta]
MEMCFDSRVATNTPHLVSLGTGRLSTAVTLHPIKQGRVTVGSDPTCDIYVVGGGVASVHCRVENSHGVVTLYPLSGSTLIDGLPVEKPTRLSQGSMLTIGRSNYLRFNHPAEAMLMKSVLPSGHMPIMQYQNDECLPLGYTNHHENQRYQNNYKETLTPLDNELDATLKEISRKKPPVAPKKPLRDLESDSNSDQETKPKISSIMSKVSKFEYYAKQQKIGRSQFYTSNEIEISPKVFSANSLTVNTPAKDVLGVKTKKEPSHKQLMRLFVDNIKKNTSALKELKLAIDIKYNRDDSDKVIEISKSVNEKLDVVHKLRNDIKIYRTINTVLTNHYIKETRNHENNIDTKIIKLERQVRQSYDDLKEEITKMASKISVANQNNSIFKNIGSPIQNSNVFVMGNEFKTSQFNELYVKSEIYNNIIKKIDKLFCGMAYQERIKEEEQKEAETARLEEILNMCAEYERQISSGVPITPTEKRPHNKIITNGSLPRSVALNNPNFVQTSDGYYKFETSHNRNNASKPLPIQRNLSSYENFDTSCSPTPIEQLTPEVTIPIQNYENVGRMDEIGIPVFDEPQNVSSPIMIRKNQSDNRILTSPIGSPYENVYFNRNNVYANLKPKSPNTQSPRTRIKTSFAHKNLPSPQYFIFPTPPPVDNSNKPNFENGKPKVDGIEKQLSLEEEIPMIDDAAQPNDIELRYSRIIDKDDKEEVAEKSPEIPIEKNQSFDDVKKELMADIPELEEFEKDLQKNKRDKIIKNITEDMKKIDIEADSMDSTVLDENVDELKSKYEKLKEDRKKLVTEIHDIKNKMSEIRSQEDDVLRELEMEKALIKGEYDSEIAILNIEQKKKQIW